jgi:hypothetical protein
MSNAKSVLLIGLDPDVVNYSNYPGLTPEKLEAALRADEARLEAAGLDAAICFIDHGETAVATVTKALAEQPRDVILIGAGVRTDPAEFLLFERLVNLVHEQAPNARLCFNTGPTDSVDAVMRWL